MRIFSLYNIFLSLHKLSLGSCEVPLKIWARSVSVYYCTTFVFVLCLVLSYICIFPMFVFVLCLNLSCVCLCHMFVFVLCLSLSYVCLCPMFVFVLCFSLSYVCLCPMFAFVLCLYFSYVCLCHIFIMAHVCGLFTHFPCPMCVSFYVCLSYVCPHSPQKRTISSVSVLLITAVRIKNLGCPVRIRLFRVSCPYTFI